MDSSNFERDPQNRRLAAGFYLWPRAVSNEFFERSISTEFPAQKCPILDDLLATKSVSPLNEYQRITMVAKSWLAVGLSVCAFGAVV